MHLTRTLITVILFVSAGACLAQNPPSAQRAQPDLKTRVASMEDHYAKGRYGPAMVVGKRMCTQEGVVRACVLAGEILEKGMGMPANPGEAAKLYSRACAEKDKAMCWRAAGIYLALVAKEPVPDGIDAYDWLGLSESNDAYGAMAAYSYACDQGDAKACYEGAGMYYSRSMGKRTMKAYDKGCELKHADSCYAYGNLLQFGLGGPDGVSFDHAGAKLYWRKACDLGKKEACAKLK